MTITPGAYTSHIATLAYTDTLPDIRVNVNDQAFWRGENCLGLPHPLNLKGVTTYLLRLDESALSHQSTSLLLRSHSYKEESIGKWASGTRAERRIKSQQ